MFVQDFVLGINGVTPFFWVVVFKKKKPQALFLGLMGFICLFRISYLGSTELLPFSGLLFSKRKTSSPFFGLDGVYIFVQDFVLGISGVIPFFWVVVCK